MPTSPSPCHRFDGRVVVVTGGASGIGAATVVRLAAEGAAVAAMDLDLDRARAVAAGHDGVIAVAVDVVDPASITRAISEVERDLGAIDGLAHLAGVDAHHTIKAALPEQRRALADGERPTYRGAPDLPIEEWERVVRTNLDGTFLVTRAVLDLMMERRSGAIVTTASTTGMTGAAGVSHYSASKGAVRVYTQAIAREAAAYGVRVNSVAPGATDTPMLARTPHDALATVGTIPLGRVAHPDELAAAIAFLLSDDASYVVGETLNVNGGMVIL